MAKRWQDEQCEHNPAISRGDCDECLTNLVRERDEACGAMKAQDERERVAGQMAGVLWEEHGCDWPDAIAEKYLALKAARSSH